MRIHQYKDWHGPGRMLAVRIGTKEARVYLGFKHPPRPFEFQWRVYRGTRCLRVSDFPKRPGQLRTHHLDKIKVSPLQ